MDSRSSSEAHRSPLALVALLLLACSLAGCARVRPDERALLADPAMTFGGEGTPGAHEAHVLSNREAAFGGAEARGGGCGCN